MRLYKNLIICTTGVVILSFIGLTILTSVLTSYNNIWINYGQMITSGIMASAILLFINAIIGYKIERKKQILLLYYTVINLYSRWGTVEYSIKSIEGRATLADKDIEKYYCFSVEGSENFSFQTNNCFEDATFLMRCSKLRCKYCDIKKDINKLVLSMLLFREEIHDNKENPAKAKQIIIKYQQNLTVLKLVIEHFKELLITMKWYSPENDKKVEEERDKMNNKIVIEETQSNG